MSRTVFENVTIIDLWDLEATCCVCDAITPCRWGLAVYCGQIVPDDYDGEWGGAPCCLRCYNAWQWGFIQPWMTFSQAKNAVEVRDDANTTDN